jgi:hypothetical protein
MMKKLLFTACTLFAGFSPLFLQTTTDISIKTGDKLIYEAAGLDIK